MDIRLLLDFLLQGSLSERVFTKYIIVFHLLFIKYIIAFIYFFKTLFELLRANWGKNAQVFLVSFFQAK